MRVGGGTPQIPARHDLATTTLACSRVGGDLGQRLIHRLGGQSQVGRLAAGTSHLPHRRQQHPLHLLGDGADGSRSEEHTSELQSRGHLVCRLLLETKKRYLSSTSHIVRRLTNS